MTLFGRVVRRRALWTVSIVLLVLGLGSWSVFLKPHETRDLLKVWTYMVPFSTDPLLYDESVHHLAFRGVYSSLVTEYAPNGMDPDLASEWHSSTDQKIWTFKIRKGLTFSDGSPLDAEVIRKSLTRAAFLLKAKGSHSGLLEHLKGFQDLRSIHQVDGIAKEQVGDEQEVVLTFTQSMPRLLELISFGLYGIVSPHDYDSNDGHWLNPRYIRASGSLRVVRFDERSIELERWRNPEPSAPSRISLEWSDGAKDGSDLVLANSRTPLREGQAFAGGPASSIVYMHCLSWKAPNGACYSIQTRRWLKNKFYEALTKSGMNPPSTFFPPSLVNEQEPAFPRSVGEPTQTPIPLRVRLNKSASSNTPKLNQALRSLIETPPISGSVTDPSSEEQSRELDPNLDTYSTDIVGRYTGILLEYPEDDVRFMFESKEGIRLPDPTGKIRKLLRSSSLDLHAIDAQLQEDSIIWPVDHCSVGLVYNRDLLDFSQLNLIQPATDLSRIRFKR